MYLQVWAILLSDMMILTKEDDDGTKLVVLQNPIHLEYVLNVDNTNHRKFHRLKSKQFGLLLPKSC